MNSDLLEMISLLPSEVFLFIEDGPLKNKLIERYLEEDDAHGDILDFELDASLRIVRREGRTAKLEGRLEAGEFLYQTSFAAEDFAGEELSALLEQLRPHCPLASSKAARPGRIILRKKTSRGLLGIAEAANTLSLSHRALKALIPCSEIRIAETNGDKSIEEYYWEKDLIGRLASLGSEQKEGREADREDVAFIAACCCDGDLPWAREIIAGFLQQRSRTGD